VFDLNLFHRVQKIDKTPDQIIMAALIIAKTNGQGGLSYWELGIVFNNSYGLLDSSLEDLLRLKWVTKRMLDDSQIFYEISADKEFLLRELYLPSDSHINQKRALAIP
jgi:hypothetical protein